MHLKDLQFQEDKLALSGVLDLVPFEQPERRAWIFRTIGQGHGPEFWSDFTTALHEVGYRDVLSIENEDPTQLAEDGVSQGRRIHRGPAGGARQAGDLKLDEIITRTYTLDEVNEGYDDSALQAAACESSQLVKNSSSAFGLTARCQCSVIFPFLRW